MANTELILASEVTRIGQDPRLLAKRCKRGEIVRVRRGVYVRAGYWAQITDRERHGLRAAALVNTTITPPTFNLQTAGLLWGLGVIGVPDHLCTVTEDPNGGRSKHGVRRTLGSTDEGVAQVGDFRVTDKHRTAVELASRLKFGEALAVIDSSRRKLPLREGRDGGAPDIGDWNKDTAWGPPADTADLAAAVSRLTSMSKQTQAKRIIEMSTDRSESVGESMSRAHMIMLNFPVPRLQGSFTLRNGRTARTDFWWPELDLVGEFDGAGKYLRNKLRGNQTIQQVVMSEKARENGLRALGLTVVRWDWADMMNPRMFSQILNDGGLRSLRAA
ncbi:hypothetical protein ACFRJ9_08140 [Paenarthrobacter sp. NPDC056912]|uniref:hypothetical protein n=1 Tax=Paenarthrobacter sp. NPDC056912 TaxID=3345965 RepID=UPI00366B8CA4